MRKAKMKKRIINEIGCLIARWILHNCKDGLVIKRKGGADQIIKVFLLRHIKILLCQLYEEQLRDRSGREML